MNPEQNESFIEQIDTLFDELSFAVQWQRPSILLASCGSETLRRRAELALQERLAGIGQQLRPFVVDETHFDIPLLLSQRADRDASVYSVVNLSQGGGKGGANAYQALNMRREYFVDFAIRVVFWLEKDEAVQLSEHAPDFWAFRHREVEFTDTIRSEPERVPIRPPAGSVSAYPSGFESLDEEIASLETRLAGHPRQSQPDKTRLDLLARLAAMYWKKGAYIESINRSKRALPIAKELNDLERLAELWGNLGNNTLELGQWNRAVRAYRKATRYNPRSGAAWRRLGHFYHVGKRFSDAIIAYKQAVALDKRDILAQSGLIACYRLAGKNGLAEEQRKLVQPEVQEETEYYRAIFEASCGNASRALELLETAMRKKQASEGDVRRNPNFDLIQDDPGFERIIQGNASSDGDETT